MEPKVYFAKLADGSGPETQAKAAGRVLKACGTGKIIGKSDMVLVKVHVGEKNNTTHVRPEVVAEVVRLAKKAGGQPFLTDTATLYKGERENAIKHALHAERHGFSIAATGAPFLAIDGLSGSYEREVKISARKKVKIAAEVFMSDSMIVVTHVTGHIEAGLGAAIKNVGMGLASRAGKMRQHSTIMPEVKPDKCEGCGKCRKWCPKDAIGEKEGISYIRQEDCIGCGECLAVCRFGAIKYDYKVESPRLQKNMAEHAAGAVKHFGDKAVYLNVMADMTKDCDCINRKQKKMTPDIGILASTDMVAIDQASLDLTRKVRGKDLVEEAWPHLDPGHQIKEAEKLGLGKMEYALVEV